jgi:hypothetical protein
VFDLHVGRAVRRAAIGDAERTQALDERVELGIAHPEAVVQDRQLVLDPDRCRA